MQSSLEIVPHIYPCKVEKISILVQTILYIQDNDLYNEVKAIQNLP